MEEKIPFIYLLSSPNGKYFYDVNTNEVVSVSEKVYEVLKRILRKENVDLGDDIQQEIMLIKNMGYLSDNKVEIIEHPSLPYMETYLERKVQKITLQVTQGCNLRCSYCIYSDVSNEKQRSHSTKRLTFDMAKQAVDFLVQHSIDSENVNIGFYGGEPLLEFELIKNIVFYAEQAFIGKELDFNITSNGTLLTDEMIEFFIKHKVSLMISIDGPSEIHNSSRRFACDGTGSFEVILHNLEQLKTKYPEYIDKIQISMVINPQNDYSCINSVFVDYEIFKHMPPRSSVIDDIYSVEKITYSDAYIEEENYQIFLAYLAHFGRINKEYISPIAQQDITQLITKIDKMVKMHSLPQKYAPSGPCIPGQIRLFVNADGNFYPCERVSETSNVMQIGNITEGFDYKKASNLLNVGSVTSNECSNCWAIHHCNLCGKHADDGDRFSREFKLTHCKGVRESLKADLQNMILIKEAATIYQ